jgi:ribonucleoside-triphosphate reductase
LRSDAPVSEPQTFTSSHRASALTSLVLYLAVAGAAAVVDPGLRALALYAAYVVPAHLLISVLAHEPMLFEAAKHYPPLLIASVGTVGCLVAALLDYAMIGWVVNHRLVKTELDDSRAFRTAQRWFGRAPFLLVTASAFFPVPFYPAKILAIAREYPASRFLAAVLVGRLPRFYLLALVGGEVNAPRSALVSAGITLGLFAAWGIWRTVRRNRLRAKSRR